MDTLFFVIIVAFVIFVVVAAAAAANPPPHRPTTPRQLTPEELDQKAALLRAQGRLHEEETRYKAALLKAEMAHAELEDTRAFLKTRNDPKKGLDHA